MAGPAARMLNPDRNATDGALKRHEARGGATGFDCGVGAVPLRRYPTDPVPLYRAVVLFTSSHGGKPFVPLVGPRGKWRARTRAVNQMETKLEAVLAEQDRLSQRHDAAIGTSTELGARLELRAAGDQVAAREAWLHWVDDESYRGLNAGPFELCAESLVA